MYLKISIYQSAISSIIHISVTNKNIYTKIVSGIPLLINFAL